MPLAVSAGAPHPPPRVPGRGRWLGRGSGGQARGVVVHLARLDAAPALPPDAVIVTRSVTPAMTFLLHRAVAVVSEHGGLLGHGAAIARELGLPCVVGCTGAWSQLRDGDRVWVDGAAGVVVRL